MSEPDELDETKPDTWNGVLEAIRTLQSLPAGRWYAEELHHRAGRILRRILAHDPSKYPGDTGYRHLLQLQAAYGAYSEMLAVLTGASPESILSGVIGESPIAGGASDA